MIKSVQKTYVQRYPWRWHWQYRKDRRNKTRWPKLRDWWFKMCYIHMIKYNKSLKLYCSMHIFTLGRNENYFSFSLRKMESLFVFADEPSTVPKECKKTLKIPWSGTYSIITFILWDNQALITSIHLAFLILSESIIQIRSLCSVQFSSVQSLSRVQLFVTPWVAWLT